MVKQYLQGLLPVNLVLRAAGPIFLVNFACIRDPGIKLPEKAEERASDSARATAVDEQLNQKNENADESPILPVKSAPVPSAPASVNINENETAQPAPRVQPSPESSVTVIPEAAAGAGTPPLPPAPPVPAPGIIIANGAYTVKLASNLRCFDIPLSSLLAQTQLQVYDCNKTTAQIFVIDQIEGSTYKITNKNSGFSMSIRGLNPVAGALLEQFPFQEDPSQKFTIEKTSGNNFIIKPKGSLLVVSVANTLGENETPLALAVPNGTLLQQWIITPSP